MSNGLEREGRGEQEKGCTEREREVVNDTMSKLRKKIIALIDIMEPRQLHD